MPYKSLLTSCSRISCCFSTKYHFGTGGREYTKKKNRSLIKGLQFPSHYLALFISVYICLVTCFLIHGTSYIRLLDLKTVSNLTIFIYLGIHGSSWYSNDKRTLLFRTTRRNRSEFSWFLRGNILQIQDSSGHR